MKLLAWFSKKEYERKRQIKMIAASSYFDAEWYYKQYPDVKNSGIDAAKHYLMFGWRESRNPGPNFDTNDYLQLYPELLSYGINPLIHFIVEQKELSDKNDVYFNAESYAQQYITYIKNKYSLGNIFKLLLNNKENENVIADRKLDNDYQLLENSSLFNKKWYIKKYLKANQINPITHYLSEGWRKGYNPSKKFDTEFYLSKYPEVARSGINPLLHYLRYGKNEGRTPKAPKISLGQRIYNKLLNNSVEYKEIYKSDLFDSNWYLKQYPEVADAEVNPLQHYLEVGWKEGKNPSENFDTTFYLKNNPDISKAGLNPLYHYVLFGKNEGRICMPPYKKVSSSVLDDTDFEQNPKISVLVASYNYEQYIRETLDSLVNQTYKNFEVIVIDDGSKDNSLNIIKEYTQKYPNIFLYRHPKGENRGLAETIKLGIQKSTGKYIAFCESDDCWMKNNLEEKIKVINKENSPKIIYNNVKLFGDACAKKEEYIANLSILDEGLYKAFPVLMTYNIIPTFSCVMIDKKVLQKCDFNAYIPAWLDWWIYRQIFAKYPVYHINKTLSMWRIHESYNDENKSAKYMEKFDEFIFYNNDLIVREDKNHLDNIYEDYHVKMLLNSDLFDENYYIEHYPEVKKYGLPPVYHYLKIGWKSGYNPSSKFDTRAYLNFNLINNNPLIHYLLFGEKEHRKIYDVNENSNGLTYDFVEKVRRLGKAKKLVLLFNHELTLTGAPRALLNMAISLKKQGCYPVIISWKNGPMSEEIENAGIEAVLDIYLYSKLKNRNKLYTDFLSLFDVIVFNTLVSLRFWNYLPQNSAKKIAWLHEGKEGYGIYANILNLHDIFDKLDKVYSVGKYSKAFADKYIRNREKSQILLYGIDDVNVSECRSVNSKDNDIVKFIFPGAICERKGQDILLRALDIIPEKIKSEFVVYLVGQSVDEKIADELKKRASTEKCISFWGNISHTELMKLYTDIDVVLCPSRDDPLPMVCAEAFLFGKTVIVSENTGTADFIENKKNGLLIPSADEKALAEAMIYVVEHKNKLTRIGKNARKIYEKYFTLEDFDKNVKQIAE